MSSTEIIIFTMLIIFAMTTSMMSVMLNYVLKKFREEVQGIPLGTSADDVRTVMGEPDVDKMNADGSGELVYENKYLMLGEESIIFEFHKGKLIKIEKRKGE